MNGIGCREKRWLFWFAGFFAIVFFSGICFASGGGEHGGAVGNDKLIDLLYRCINFTLLVIILFVVVKKTSVKDFFSSRREEIRRKFEDLKRQRAEFEMQYRELEERLKEFEVKRQEIIEQFRSEGELEREKIIAEAKERAKQILAQADVTIEREIRTMRGRLQEEVVELAAKRAQEIIVKSIKDADQEQLVDEFIERVEKLH